MCHHGSRTGYEESVTSLGAGAAFRVLGGSLMPVAINLIVAAAARGDAADPDGAGLIPPFAKSTAIVAGAGVSTALPTPLVSIEPYISLTNRWVAFSGNTLSNFGATLGVNLGFGTFGLHLAYDRVWVGGGSSSILGLGAHVTLRPPLGM